MNINIEGGLGEFQMQTEPFVGDLTMVVVINYLSSIYKVYTPAELTSFARGILGSVNPMNKLQEIAQNIDNEGYELDL